MGFSINPGVGTSHLLPEGATPITVTDAGTVYSKDVAGRTELFFIDSSGVEIQLTTGGVSTGGGEDLAATMVIGNLAGGTALGFAPGTLLLPGLFVEGDPNTGLAGTGTLDEFRAVCGGVDVCRFSDAGGGVVRMGLTDAEVSHGGGFALEVRDTICANNPDGAGGGGRATFQAIIKSETATAFSRLDLQRTRAASVLDGDFIGLVSFTGTGGIFSDIFVEVDGTPSAGVRPGAMSFRGYKTGSAVVHMHLNADACFGIGVTNPGVTGTITGLGALLHLGNVGTIPTGTLTGGGALHYATAGAMRFKQADGTDLGASGVANSQFTDVGTVGAGEDTLQTFTLPANALNVNGKAIKIRAVFTTAANANIKTIKLHFGSTVIANSGAADINNRIIYFDAIVVRTGASAQRSTTFRVEGVSGSLADNTLVIRTNPAEDTTAAIVIKGTGEGVSNDDVVQISMLVEFLN